jgi:uncharacterized Zn finger protein
MRYYDTFPPYVPVAQRRAKAAKQLQQMQKKNPNLKPVMLTGNSLASTWWGKSWNSNLERYADYSNRIGRGRSYVRNRAVLDLQITPETITALVQGSRSQPYKITITIGPLSAGNWSRIRQACEGHLDSLSELLAGQFPQALKDLFFEKGAGLFPAPHDIHFDCSCPDWASMCKHIAAALYGVGARLDADPALFFTLRGINIDDLITETLTETAQTLLGKAERQSQNILHDVDLGDVFGIQLDDLAVPDVPAVQPPASTARKQGSSSRKTTARQQAMPATTRIGTQRRVPSLPGGPVARKTAPASAATTRMGRTPIVPVAPMPPPGTMLEVLVKALGTARRGKTVAQLQAKLGWTRVQVRNTIRRADAKGLIEAVAAEVYRRKV